MNRVCVRHLKSGETTQKIDDAKLREFREGYLPSSFGQSKIVALKTIGYYECVKAVEWGCGYFRHNVYFLETAFLLNIFFPMAYLIVWALPMFLILIALVF